MNAPVLGVIVGGVLGLVDGLSAWLNPEARLMMLPIVVGSTIKGVLTGLAAGLVARWRRSLALGIAVGVAAGFVLSTLAALGQADHYWEIVLPGMIVGALAGFVTQRSARATMALVVLAAATLHAGAVQTGDVSLAALDPLIGRWRGTSEGQPGNGTVEREYTRALGARFVHGRNRSVYAPQEKNPKGESHENWDLFSFDRGRKRVVLRQFHSEGFVNQYVSEPIEKAGTIVFTSEAIENIPTGWRARESYTVIGPNEVEEVFELAEPGKPFMLYSRTRLRRVEEKQ